MERFGWFEFTFLLVLPIRLARFDGMKALQMRPLLSCVLTIALLALGATGCTTSDDDDDEVLIPELAPSMATVEADRAFDLLDDAELDRVGELLESAVISWPQRRSRRSTAFP